MQRLSMAFNTELSELRLATYWDALHDLPVEAVAWACQHAVKHLEKFPPPVFLRQYVGQYREEKLRRAEEEAEKLLPQWSSTPDEVGVAAIRDVLRMLGDGMAMPTHPAYAAPSEESPEERKARLLEQALKIEALTPHNGKA